MMNDPASPAKPHPSAAHVYHPDTSSGTAARPSPVLAVVPRRLPWALSAPGLFLAVLFFAAALTPTLIPRSYLTQGVLAGAAAGAGYGVGALLGWIWRYLEIPPATGRLRQGLALGATVLALAVALYNLSQAARWQNSIRVRMDMEPVLTTHPTLVSLLALATFIVILLLGRGFGRVTQALATRGRRLLPRRVANLLGATAAVVLVWALASDVLFRGALHMLDASFREYDALLEPESPQPTDPTRTGGPGSLVAWEKLGRAGREFIASGPLASDITALSQRPAIDPIRVYVGLRAADTPAARARLALDELRRVGGFDRANLVIITPTGTGWVDPAAIAPLEYLLDGDIASVATQYSYLSSPLSLLAQPEYGADASRALFVEIYRYWQTLPPETRPRLYLHGLSLGAMNSQQSFELFEILGAPIDGALWSGPPFESRLWRTVTHDRNPGSPAWLPEFRDGSLIRFQNQDGSRVPADAPWGPTRLVYLQYASDPITFFDYRDLYRRPAWMEGEMGPDVSPELRWYPVVTMLQLALDMAISETPMGYGHIYAPEHYVDAWQAVIGEHAWSASTLATLRETLATQARQEMADSRSEDNAYEYRGG